MTFTLFHNKNCSKSRVCLDILKKHKIDFQLREYIKDPLTLSEITDILKKLSGEKSTLLRKQTKELDFNDLITYVYENQNDLQRPIFFDGKKYTICRPPERVLDCI